MATIKDIDIPDFSELSDDEITTLIRRARQRRRTPSKEVKEATVAFVKRKAKKGKPTALTDTSKMANGLSAEQAKELLKTLGG